MGGWGGVGPQRGHQGCYIRQKEFVVFPVAKLSFLNVLKLMDCVVRNVRGLEDLFRVCTVLIRG